MHTPMRMCVACRQMQPQNELIRVVRENTIGAVMLDMNKKLMGRGAYICKNAECVRKAKKKRGLERHFKCAVSDEIYEAAERFIQQ